MEQRKLGKTELLVTEERAYVARLATT